jgi:hypothetical protein
MALSPPGASVPYVLYATGTLCNTPPDSRSTCGIIANVWSGMSLLYGFSGCAVTLSVQLLAVTVRENYETDCRRERDATAIQAAM